MKPAPTPDGVPWAYRKALVAAGDRFFEGLPPSPAAEGDSRDQPEPT